MSTRTASSVSDAQEPGSDAELCQEFYQHPEGEDVPFEVCQPYRNLREKSKPTFLEAKAGDIYITHDFLPHAVNANRRHYARVVTNPHVSLTEPLQLYRKDKNYVGRRSDSADNRLLSKSAFCTIWVDPKDCPSTRSPGTESNTTPGRDSTSEHESPRSWSE